MPIYDSSQDWRDWRIYHPGILPTGGVGNSAIWYQWNEHVNQMRPLVSDPWVAWTTQTTQTLTYRDEVWGYWNSIPPVTGSTTLYGVGTAETPQEMNDRLARERDQREVRRQRDEQRRVARVRARSLLDGFLSAEQRAELGTHGHFRVVGSRGRCYRIHARGQSGNVELLRADGTRQALLCAHPTFAHDGDGLLPEGDAWLAQMFYLQHDEDEFLRKANVHRGSLEGVRRPDRSIVVPERLAAVA